MSNIETISDIPNSTTKEFMEWFTSQYDGYYLPGDLDHITHKLLGAMAVTEDDTALYLLLSDCYNRLVEYRTLLSLLKQSGYKMGRGNE